MGNDQSKPFSSQGQTLGGVPVAGSSTGSAPFSPLSARPTPKPAPQPKPTPTAAPTLRPAPPGRMPGSGQQLDGSAAAAPAARAPLSERLASASSGAGAEDAEKKARDAREAAAKAAEKRMKGAAAAKAGTGKLPPPNTGEKMPERVIYE